MTRGARLAGGMRSRLLSLVTQAAMNIPGAPRAIGLAIVDDATMKRVHAEFLGKRSTTDVMSFLVGEDEAEIVVCLCQARREARARKGTLLGELVLYAIHGILHQSGYDDLDPAAWAKMHREEDRILTAIGLGAVFAGTEPEEKDRR